MIKFKKIISGLLLVSILGVGCSIKEETKPIKIAALNGPTGIGMVKLMDNEAYETSLYQSPDEIVGKVVNGEVDIACVPSNLAAVLYNKTQGDIKLLATNTLGVLYVLEHGSTVSQIGDLKGKTILLSGKGSAPEFILKNLLIKNGLNPDSDVTFEYYANHADIATTLIANEGTIALLPQPFVTTVVTKKDTVKVAIDLNEEWTSAENMELPMGTIIGRTSFIEENESLLNKFFKDYKESVDFVNNQTEEAAKLVAQYEIVPNETVAKMAIPECNIVFRDSEESKDSLNKFYEVLSSNEPKSVGGKIPDEGFYFKNK